MTEQVYREIIQLDGMTAKSLQHRYFEVFGESSNSCNAAYLHKRIVWRIQSLSKGGLSERAQRRSG